MEKKHIKHTIILQLRFLHFLKLVRVHARSRVKDKNTTNFFATYSFYDDDAFLHLRIQVAFLDEMSKCKGHHSKCRTGRKNMKEDVFHLDDDATKDYLKGKDRGLLLADRYEREKKRNEKENQMYGIYLYFPRSKK